MQANNLSCRTHLTFGLANLKWEMGHNYSTGKILCSLKKKISLPVAKDIPGYQGLYFSCGFQTFKITRMSQDIYLGKSSDTFQSHASLEYLTKWMHAEKTCRVYSVHCRLRFYSKHKSKYQCCLDIELQCTCTVLTAVPFFAILDNMQGQQISVIKNGK